MCWPGLLNSSNFFPPKFIEHFFIRIIFLPWNVHHIILQLKTLIGSLLPRSPNTNSSHTIPAPFQRSHFSTVSFSSITGWIFCLLAHERSLLLGSVYALHTLNLTQDAHFTFTYQPLLASLIIRLNKSHLIWEAIFQRKLPGPGIFCYKSPLHLGPQILTYKLLLIAV